MPFLCPRGEGPGAIETGAMAWASLRISLSTSLRAAAGLQLHVPGAAAGGPPCAASRHAAEGNQAAAPRRARRDHNAHVRACTSGRVHRDMHMRTCACVCICKHMRGAQPRRHPEALRASPVAGRLAVRFIRHRPPTPTASRDQIPNPTRNRILIPGPSARPKLVLLRSIVSIGLHLREFLRECMMLGPSTTSRRKQKRQG